MSGHWSFVFAAYGVAATIVAVMIVAVIGDYRTLVRQLAALEKAGGRRIGSGP